MVLLQLTRRRLVSRRARSRQILSDAGLARIAVRTRFFDDALQASCTAR